jgi:hypothetical protein
MAFSLSKPPATVNASPSESAGGQSGEQHEKRRDHPRGDHRELVFLRQAHRRAAADRGVDDDEQAARHDGEVERPAEDRGEHDRRRVNRETGADPALQEKQRRAEQARLLVEAPPEKFVGRVDVEPAENRQENNRDDDQRERSAEIILHETEPVLVALAGRGEKRRRAGLRGHHRHADGEPAGVGRAREIRAEVAPAARAPRAVGGNAEQRADENEVIERVHENFSVNSASSAIHNAKIPSTRIRTNKRHATCGSPADPAARQRVEAGEGQADSSCR